MKRKPINYWTFETCLEDAKKYSSYRSWNGSVSYDKAIKMGWARTIAEMAGIPPVKKPEGYWNSKENCLREALKYKFRSEFEKNNQKAVAVARANGWMDEICAHMKPKANIMTRGLYVFEHPDKSVYVGLTWNYEQRYKEHMRKNRVLIKKRLWADKFLKH
jgi:hypothetical protein